MRTFLRRMATVMIALTLAGCASKSLPTTKERPVILAPVPAPVPAPPLGPTRPDSMGDLTPTPGAFTRTLFRALQPIDRPGIFFLNSQTGLIEGWTLSGDKGDAYYSVTDDNAWITASLQQQQFVLNRRTGLVVQATQGRVWLLDAQGERALITSDGYLWLTENGMRSNRWLSSVPPSTTQTQALFSPDGQTLIVKTSDNTVYQIDPAHSQGQPLVLTPAADPNNPIRYRIIQRLPKDAGFIIRSFGGSDSAPIEAGKHSYSWQGQEFVGATIGLERGWYAANGEWAAQGDVVANGVSAVNIFDRTGQPKLRVLGAGNCFSAAYGNHWLADSSGFVMGTAVGDRILQVDGTLKALPSMASVNQHLLPAPDRTDRFAWGLSVVDAQGKSVVSVALDPSKKLTINQFIYPWGVRSDELRFATNAVGKGGGEMCNFPLPPKVEYPPFAPDLAVTVGLPANDCLNLRERPDSKTKAITCAPGGTRLTITPWLFPNPKDPTVIESRPSVEADATGYWFHVRAPNGEEGWANALAGRIGYAP